MATVIKGLLSQNLPWGLVIIGMGIAAVMELSGVRSLPFAVGAYLPLSTSSPIFIGGLVKWFVDSRKKDAKEESEIGPGALFSSGLIAGGAITGIIIAILIGTNVGTDAEGRAMNVVDLLNTGLGESLGAVGDLISLILFAALAAILFKFAMSKEEKI
jgi:uncharacterized oligopeptide transporter (OPT) family protein